MHCDVLGFAAPTFRRFVYAFVKKTSSICLHALEEKKCEGFFLVVRKN